MNNRTTIALIRLALVVIGLLLSPLLAVQADAYAATLTILHEGVIIKRANTDEWLPLAYGAVSPFGSGDRLQTGETGRALLTFWDGSQALILPRSSYRLDELEIASYTGSRLIAHLTGTAVHQVRRPSPDLVYRLEMPGMTVTQPAAWFATWGNVDAPNSVTVAEGTAEITLADQRLPVAEGEGIVGDATGHTIASFETPWNEAHLQGVIAGCPGSVNTIDGVELRVRAGPGTGFVRLGAYGFAQDVQLMAINESGGWYRVQFLSGYGWIQKLAIETACTDLPVLADDSIEDPLYIIDASAEEVDWLRAFFDFPIGNTWFYQWSEQPAKE